MRPRPALLLLPAVVACAVFSCGNTGSEFPSPDAGTGRDGALDQNTPSLGDSTLQGTTTCAQAIASKSYIGCDYWPTVTPNPVWSIFDFAVVVANTQGSVAKVTVTGPGGVHEVADVMPNSLTKIYLPWVPLLKGPDATSCGGTPAYPNSLLAKASAYHLVSTVPVTVYQFNALEFAGMGGPPGKNWSLCPGDAVCPGEGRPRGCYSYTNDASLLIPSSSMTGNYRVTTRPGSTKYGQGAFFSVTATRDGTNLTVSLSSTSTVVGGSGVPSAGPGGTLQLKLDAGDVIQVMSAASDTADLSGSLVQADKPIEVFGGIQCGEDPWGAPACDHEESSVLPVETLGKDYVVTVPTSPHGRLVGHTVRFYGNADGTVLTYSPAQPPGCPSTLDAGQVVECQGTPSCPYTDDTGVARMGLCVKDTFEVSGTHEFAVSSFMLGASIVDREDPIDQSEGDPSMSPMVATEQYRKSYVFLAPTDYTESFADVVVPTGAKVSLDGAAVLSTPSPVNAKWSVVRLGLGPAHGGAHVLTATEPAGLQVIGYGAYTSYQFPGGLDLVPIAPTPPPPK